MARASTPTWLSLDRWAAIIGGIHPAHFSGVYSSLFPDTTGCAALIMQYGWQGAGAIGREDIAQAIHDAEREIADYVGYSLLPDWVTDERHRTVRPARIDLYNTYSKNQRAQGKSVQVKRAHIISGGVKAHTLIESRAAVVRSDADGDGYQETATVTSATTVDADEIRIFYPGESGADEWEIRPAKVTSTGAVATITFKIWQLVDPDLWETKSTDASGVDGDVAANFLTAVDVYRVYNDPQTQAEFLWEEPQCATCGGSGCTACQLGAQDGCLRVRDTRQGFFVYSPATWDSTTGTFAAGDWAESREPDRLRLWYYAGWRWDTPPTGYYPESSVDPYWERAIAYLAAARLPGELCNCEPLKQYLTRWQEDMALTNQTRSYQTSTRVLDNPLGTQKGCLYAWDRMNGEGRKVVR